MFPISESSVFFIFDPRQIGTVPVVEKINVEPSICGTEAMISCASGDSGMT